MERSFFFDHRPFIYIFSGLIGYMLGIWLAFGDITTGTVMVDLNKFGHLRSVPTATTCFDINQTARLISPSDDFLNWHPKYLRWGLFMGLLMAFAGAILIPSFLLNIKIIQDFALQKKLLQNVPYILLILIIGLISWHIINFVNKLVLIPDELFERLGLLYGANVDKQFWVSRLIVVPGLFCLSGLLLINLVIVDRNARNSHDEQIETALQEELQKYFRFFAGAFSILIAGAMLTSSLLRDVVYAVIVPANPQVLVSPEWKALAPTDFILIFGLNQIVILVAVLVPSFVFIQRSGQLALKRIQFHHPTGGGSLSQQFTYQNVLLQKIWLIILVLMPFFALFANKVLDFLARQLE